MIFRNILFKYIIYHIKNTLFAYIICHIIKIQKSSDRVMPDGTIMHYPASEGYASNEEFGRGAWCYTHLKDAEVKFNQLLKTQYKLTSIPI
jgi:hypothetical protein